MSNNFGDDAIIRESKFQNVQVDINQPNFVLSKFRFGELEDETDYF